MRVSVIIPSKGCEYIKYAFTGLRNQTISSFEVILVIKDCVPRNVEKLCQKYSLNCTIVEQEKGYVTHALNIGKREAGGDVLVFTDDDVIILSKWLERYKKLHIIYRDVAGISSRDIYIDLEKRKIMRTPDDKILIKLYRWFIRPWLETPHPHLRKYRLGVYLTKRLNIAHGPFIPDKTCYSLPLRGVNMSFKREHVQDIWFPEHYMLKRAPGFEQHFGLQIILKGFDTIYVPNNPVLHIARSESLSRTRYKEELKREFKIMRGLYKELLKKYNTDI
jgi:glycosyltransferase involved in cell wall biosynthesis